MEPEDAQHPPTAGLDDPADRARRQQPGEHQHQQRPQAATRSGQALPPAAGHAVFVLDRRRGGEAEREPQLTGRTPHPARARFAPQRVQLRAPLPGPLVA
ncbi:hypothetical protein Pflav_026460 [Phytohabitans flavus]|uniref:Uncharacterized protein n=1 Tax=Phytohabitans flavus TaxID=1076124 RepID=A0A6F8XQZ6_9ACTN|nr:hypothetical protein Pflav_026460 [Phytohabitans flavus]